MIGSPASRGAVASVGCVARALFGAASAVSGVSAAKAASVARAGTRQRRNAAVDRAVESEFTMPYLTQSRRWTAAIAYTAESPLQTINSF
jgi:hypothetical protein